MKLNVPVLSQRDSRWANEKLGNSNLTIDGYGCVLVSMTMLSLYYGRQIDVPTFNKATIDAKGFKGANYDWYSIATLFPDIKFTSWKDYPLDPAPIDSIKAQIEAGKPVIVWVDINPNQPGNQQHFVILIGVEGDDFWINDPWYGDQILFSRRYVEPTIGILGHSFFSGPVPEDNTQTTDDFGLLVKKSTQWNETCKEYELGDPNHTLFEKLQAFIGGLKSRITDLTNQVTFERTEKENREQQVSRLKDQLTSEEKLRKELQDNLKEAQSAPVKLIASYEGQLKEKQTLIDTQGKTIGQLRQDLAEAQNKQEYKSLIKVFGITLYIKARG